MSYFNILSQTMSTMFVRGISEIAELLVSVRRLQEFLDNDEFFNKSTTFKNNNVNKQNQKSSISLQKLVAKWSLDSVKNALNDLNITLQKRDLLGVIGPVGSGKSSLLQTILGEFRF